MTIDLLGVPLDLGSERIGVDMGPNALRYQKFTKNVQEAGLDIHDLGNLDCPSPEEVELGDPKIKYLEPITKVCRSVMSSVISTISKNKRPLIIGGDHALAIGSITGAAKAVSGSLGVIWIDAHGDLNTPQTTLTGNIHGMPLAVLLGHGHPDLIALASSKPAIDYPNVIVIGAKDLDPAEETFIKKHHLQSFHIRDIAAEGLKPVFSAVDRLVQKTDHLWVSLDLDAVDSSEAPGVGMPNKGGLTYREIGAIASYIGKKSRLLGMDLVEYNPVNDIEHKTAYLAAELTAKLFGKDYSLYSQYLREHGIK